jgi:hypothetical protein
VGNRKLEKRRFESVHGFCIWGCIHASGISRGISDGGSIVRYFYSKKIQDNECVPVVPNGSIKIIFKRQVRFYVSFKQLF